MAFALDTRSAGEYIEDCIPHLLEFMRTCANSSAVLAREKKRFRDDDDIVHFLHDE